MARRMSAARRRGLTLIDCMVAVAILGTGAGLLVSHFNQYENATRRALAVEAVARVLDQEMERMRACTDRGCVDALETKTATTAEVAIDARSWARANVRRTVEPGPGGTLKVTIGAVLPSMLEEHRVVGLVWVSP